MNNENGVLVDGRNYGIDLLIIVSMIMVVMLHTLYHGGILNNVESGSTNYYIVWFLEATAVCAVNCYALISGYVGAKSKFRISNLVALWVRVVFYSVIISIVFIVLFPNQVGKGRLLFSLFPVLSGEYWYFTAYFLLFFFMPILNIAIQKLSFRMISFIIFALIVLLTITKPLSDIFFFPDVFHLFEGGFSAWWLMVLYLIGGYIWKYGLFKRLKTVFLVLLYALFVCLIWFSKFIIGNITLSVFGEIRYDDLFFKYDSITVLMAAVFLFLVFERIRLTKTIIRIVSCLAPLSFSVYILHDNYCVRKIILHDMFSWVSELYPIYMVLLVLGIVLGIYLFCSGIDWFRERLFLLLRIKEKLCSLENKIKAKIK